MKPKETLITVWKKRLVCHVYGAQRSKTHYPALAGIPITIDNS